MKRLSLLLASFALVLGACERHSWEDEKNEDGEVVARGVKHLYEGHGKDDGHAGDKHDGDKHPKGEKPAGEGEKPAGEGEKPAGEGEKPAGEGAAE